MGKSFHSTLLNPESEILQETTPAPHRTESFSVCQPPAEQGTLMLTCLTAEGQGPCMASAPWSRHKAQVSAVLCTALQHGSHNH